MEGTATAMVNRPLFGNWRGQENGRGDRTDLGYSKNPDASAAPTASFPTHDGPAHFGILKAVELAGQEPKVRLEPGLQLLDQYKR